MSKVSLSEEFDRDDYTIYGLWSIELEDDVVEMGGVVGVPECIQGSAKAAGGAAPAMCDAWIEDSSDWDDLSSEQQVEALAVLSAESYRLLCDG